MAVLTTQQLQTARQLSFAAITIAVVLWAWRHDRSASEYVLRGFAICVSVGYFGYLYVRCVTTVVCGDFPGYRITDVFSLIAAVAILAATGYAGDALTAGSLIVYAILCGPLWRRFVNRWTARELTTAVWTSAATLSSFVSLLTVAAAVVYVFGPWADAITPWRSPFFPHVAFLTLYPSVIFAWTCIFGDNYQRDSDLIIYGLPVGLPLNIVIGLVVGALFGLVAANLPLDGGHRRKETKS